MAPDSPRLPVIFSNDSMAYGTFTVGRTDHLEPRTVALTEPPPLAAFSRELLEKADPSLLSWDGRRIAVTLDNGSWIWVAEAQDPTGTVIYARWPD